MSITGFLRARYRGLRSRRELARMLRAPASSDLARPDWKRSLSAPTEFYCDAVRFFHRQLPVELKEHRAYFKQDGRGFGEDAFHVMWYLLFLEFKPKTFLEIGVYRGQTISLIALLAKLRDTPCSIYGISPFSSAGDSVSKYRSGLDYFADTKKNFSRFSLPQPELVTAYSTDPAARSLIASKSWSAIYIDGNHDYEVARQDWENCSAHVAVGGIVVLDDASLNTAFQPPSFATAGHPGPSRLAREIDTSRFEEILRVGHNRVFQRKA